MNASRNRTNTFLLNGLALVVTSCLYPEMTETSEDAGPAASGSGGSSATGGTHGASGSTTKGGSSAIGGSSGIAGATSIGGQTGIGGSTNAGGATGSGGTRGPGTTGVGGATNGGGSSSTGGVISTSVGGTTSTGGAATSVGGTPSSGGKTSTGGAGATSTGGKTSTGGASASSTAGGNTSTGGTPATGGVPATGGSGTCGIRNCLSASDNNCNGTADNAEPECACPTKNQTVSCSTGLPGICATGSKVCTFAADNSSSTWSACVAPTALTRNCSSSSDNNCNGTADNLESACSACGQTSPRACNTHPGYDGIGVCKAGSQTLIVASDNSQCSWSACTGDVAPTTLESCGPTAPDTNCDGVPGDGSSCGITTIHIYQYTNYVSCSCGGGTTAYSSYVAGTSSPGSGWTDVSSFNVFTGSQPAGTIAVVNALNGSQKYVTLAASYAPSDAVGFVSTSNPGGYVRLNTLTSLTGTCSTTSLGAQVPFGPGGSGSPSSYYTVP